MPNRRVRGTTSSAIGTTRLIRTSGNSSSAVSYSNSSRSRPDEAARDQGHEEHAGEEPRERRERRVVAVPPVGRPLLGVVVLGLVGRHHHDPPRPVPQIRHPAARRAPAEPCRGRAHPATLAPWRSGSSTPRAPIRARPTTWSSCSRTPTASSGSTYRRGTTEAEALLQGLGCHPMVIDGCRQRNYVPTVHGYDDHVFVTTQSPFLGRAGHVHLLELDQIIGHQYLVTVHGPINPDLDLAHALVETNGVLARIDAGRFHPTTPGRAVLRDHLGGRAPAERPDPRRSRRSCPGSRTRSWSPSCATPRRCWRRCS